MNRRNFITLLGGAAAAAMPPLVAAAQDYPNRAITLIVNFPPGGSTDAMARIIREPLSQALGQNIIIDNRGGAGGTTGAAAVANAKPDGYTLLLSVNSALTTNRYLQKNFPFDPKTAFAPITLTSDVALVLAVHQSLPVPDVTGLIEYARKNPGKLAYATPGIGSSHHICGPGLLAGLTLRKECLVLFLRNADGGPLFDSFVHLLGGEQRPDRHASEPRGICAQLGGGCGDFIGVIDNRVGGGRAVIEIPKFELASDRLDKLGDTRLEGRGRLLF